jgi:hypothetical protein
MTTERGMAEAVGCLLAAGTGQGAARAQVDAQDVLMALGGISVMTGITAVERIMDSSSSATSSPPVMEGRRLIMSTPGVTAPGVPTTTS